MTLAARLDASRKLRLAPPPKRTVADWADTYRVIPSGTGPEPGPWRTSRAPYLRGVMDALADPLIETVVMMTAVQVGKTEVLINAVGYYAHQDPSAMLVVQPTVELAQSFSKERLSPTIAATPVLRELFGDATSRATDNTIQLKQFPGGTVALVGANSPSGLAGRPRRVVLLDEVDRYPPSAGTEGDPVSIAKKRTTNYWNRKVLLTSSPTVRGFSRIESAYAESDMRRYLVPCPECGEAQSLRWRNVHWEAGQPETAHMVCEGCGVRWEEQDKGRLLAAGSWVAEHPGRRTAGFHLNALYSPWARWEELVREWGQAQGVPERLRVFVNTVLAETYQEDAERVEAAALMARREDYGTAAVPALVGALTAGVDVQGDRIEVLVRGWGAGEESALVHIETLRGDPSRREVWADVDRVLTRTWDGLGLAAVCIDSGYLPDSVYAYVAPRQRKRVYATKGLSRVGQAITSKFGPPNRAGVRVLTVGVDAAKDLLFLRLKAAQGPGAYHWPLWADEDYFGQLTAEQAVTRYTHGRPYRQYIKDQNRRNEALDMEVLAYAALQTLGPTYIRGLGALAAKRQPVPPVPAQPDLTPAQEAVRRVLRPPRPPNWLHRF